MGKTVAAQWALGMKKVVREELSVHESEAAYRKAASRSLGAAIVETVAWNLASRPGP